MIVIVFRSKLRPDCPASYGPLADRMVELAQQMPGFRSFRHYAADDGERVSIVEFASEDAVRAWREHPEHVEAQRRGRDEFYAWYRIQVCGQAREREFFAET